jgi:hypothetical protein
MDKTESEYVYQNSPCQVIGREWFKNSTTIVWDDSFLVYVLNLIY